MRLSRRVLGIGVVVVVVGGLATVLYLRFGRTSPSAGTDATAQLGALAGGSSNGAYATDLPIPVGGAPVVQDTMVMLVQARGQAAAWRAVEVRAEVGGRVLDVPAYNDKPVAAGDLLVTIDSTDYALQLANAQAELRAADLRYQDLTLGDDRMITDSTVRQERERTARARSGLDQAQVAVKQARLKLARARVRAPFGGRVANLAVVAGQTVGQGEVLMSVVDLDPIKIEVQVLENNVSYLKVGDQAQLTFPALPDTTLSGRVQTINPMVDTVYRKALVTLSVPNPGKRILPGFYAQASLATQKFPDRIMVPSSAILEQNHRTMVFLFEGDGTTGHAHSQFVATGRSNGEYTEIVHDPTQPGTVMLKPGQIVLTSGHHTLTEGAAVRLTTNPTPPGKSPQ